MRRGKGGGAERRGRWGGREEKGEDMKGLKGTLPQQMPPSHFGVRGEVGKGERV